MKSDKIMYNTSTEEVSTLAVEWIEIAIINEGIRTGVVSTLAVEWIEIGCVLEKAICRRVSTLAVEWIEIFTSLS